MADDVVDPGSGEKPTDGKGAADWKPPTREEWEALQRQALNKAEEAARIHKKLADIEAAKRAAEEEAAKKRGEFESLYKKEAETRKSLEARLKAIEEAQEAELAEMVKDWDDDMKSLIPASLPVQERLALARKLASKLGSQQQKPGPSTRPPGGRTGAYGGYESLEEWAEKDPKGFLEAKRKEGRLKYFA